MHLRLPWLGVCYLSLTEGSSCGFIKGEAVLVEVGAGIMSLSRVHRELETSKSEIRAGKGLYFLALIRKDKNVKNMMFCYSCTSA